MAHDTGVKRHLYNPDRDTRLTAAVAADTMSGVKGATLGQRLKSARETRGLGVNELTRLVRLPGGEQLSEGYISSIETGRKGATDMPARYAVALAETLGIRPQWLVAGHGPPEFASGEMPAMTTAAKTDKPHLERVLSASNTKGRWSEQTVAAARATEGDRQLSEWPGVLDKLETAIRRVIGQSG